MGLFFLAFLPAAAQTTLFEAAPDTLTTIFSGMPAWGDYDNDGDLDLYLVGGRVSLLYRNDEGVLAEPEPFAIAPLGPPNFARQSGAAWGDYDRDGDLDLAVQAPGDDGIFRNDEGTFVRVFDGLGFDSDCGLQWGDYDADLDLDLLTCTGFQSNARFRLYINVDNDFFLSSYQPSGYNDAVDWGDFDNDGDLDLVLPGSPRARPRIAIHVGGDQQYENGMTLSEMGSGTITAYFEWVDIDSDGDLDLFASSTAPRNIHALVYLNTGTDTLEVASTNGLVAMNVARGAWGDLDNDGDLDLAISGWISGGNRRAYVYLNQTVSSPSFRRADTLAAASGESPALADFDKDGDLDLVLTHDGTVLYLNRTADRGNPNTPPSAPTGLHATYVDSATVALAWQRATDDHTPVEALTYNLRIGTAPGRGDVFSAMAHPDGQRKVVAPGNVGFRTAIVLPDLDHEATHYWSVQAIDQGWAGSSFAAEQTFSLPVNTEKSAEVPAALRLGEAYPNPFRTETTFTYDLAHPAFVSLHLFDTRGRRVATLFEGRQRLGRHRQTWKATGLPSGLYFARFVAEGHVQVVAVLHLAE